MHVIVDGSGWLYRAFHALPPLTGPDGQPTHAVLGFGNMLRKLLRQHDPEHLVIVFDAPGKTFRHDLHADYKAHRPPVPPDLKAQFAPIVELIELLGLQILQVPDVEADDVIATLAAQAGSDPVQIVSSDKDLAQLVDDRVQMLDVFKSRVIDRAAVEEKFGVPPERVADWLALVGDTSDNVPGLPGVGPKTAAKWLQEYGDLDSVLAQAEQIKGKAGETLRAHRDQVVLAQQLTVLRADVDLPSTWAELSRSPAQEEGLQRFATQMGFRSWQSEGAKAGAAPAARAVSEASATDGPSASTPGQRTIQTTCVQTLDQLTALANELRAAERFAVDTETSSLDPLTTELVGMSFATRADRAWYVPIAHNTRQEQLPCAQVAELLAPLLADPSTRRVLQNGKFDAPILARHGMPLGGPWDDTQLLSYVYEAHERHDMDTLAERWLGHTTTHYADVVGKGRKQINFRDVPVAVAADYAGEDAAITLELYEELMPRVAADAQLLSVYEELDRPLAPVLQAMEERGITLDRDVLAAADRDFSRDIDFEERQCHELAGEAFNLGSPAQLGQILFDKLGLPVLHKTPKGAPSTAEATLEELAEQHELPRRILRWRMLSKLRSTYTRALDAAINPDTGRVHCRFQQAVASTGRLSCADPNLQNIPIRRAEGRRIREAFVADTGFELLALDYSQVELRLMAHFSEDPLLISAFADGADIHRRTAAQVWGLNESAVDDDQRRAAKAVNFGLIYGISAFGLARNLGIGRGEAEDIISRFFGAFPRVREYMDAVRADAAERGEVRTLRGRRLVLSDIRSRNGNRRQAAERVAINAPLQGTAADIIKQAMLDINRSLGRNDDVRMLLQVHDELVFEVRADMVTDAARSLSAHMTAAADLRVPLVVESGHGHSWAEAH
ncbi:MAG: DNA polymerase I [Oceanococcaceae bacterium]